MSHAELIGTVLHDTYRVDEYLGAGGYGEVYGGVDLRLEIPVAIKVLHRTGTERDLRDFLNEARLLARLNHPHVVRIFFLGEHAERRFIVMERIEGRTLAKRVEAGDLDMRQRLEVMRQAAGGLRAIHGMHILHRDLSTNNIMVTAGGEAKILDLGISRSQSVTMRDPSGELRGTLYYFAPEQVLGGGSSEASEIFSFGSILYEALSGVNPFQAEHYTSVLYNIAHRDPVPIEQRVPGCSEALAALVRECLDKDASRRPADMGEVERRLAEALGTAAADVAVPEAPSPEQRHAATTSNPYLNRVMIKRREDFFGRRQEVRRIYARLNATPPGSISIVGDRKIGKSSLLNHVYMASQRQRHLEHPETMVMVFLDLQVEKQMSISTFVRILLGIATYELRGRVDLSSCTESLDGVREMVKRLDAGGFRLALLLDEFDVVTTNPNFDLEFFSFLRYLANHYNVAYLTSSARNLQQLCHTKEISDSPFFNIFSTMRLSAFSPEEAAELIRVPSARAGRPLERFTTEIVEMSGLFPFFVQMACAHTMEYLEEHPGREPDFREIHRRFYEEAQLHYRYIWDGFDEHERSAVVRVAAGKSIPDSLRHVVEELSSRKYVERDGPSRLFSATFEKFVQAEAKGEGKSFLSRFFGRGD